MLFSVLGLDGYLCNQGLIPFDFYKLGEWFLGCIIILYLIYPLIRKAVDTFPLPVMIIAIGLYTACVRMTSEIGSWHFFLRIPEMMMGILFVKYRVWERRRFVAGNWDCFASCRLCMPGFHSSFNIVYQLVHWFVCMDGASCQGGTFCGSEAVPKKAGRFNIPSFFSAPLADSENVHWIP